MLFNDYGEMQKNKDFVFLYERLVVYGLLPYYFHNKNTEEVKAILKIIHWENHEFRYKLFYKILPKFLVRYWFKFLKLGLALKRKILKK
jgi:hypothetical protein